MAYFTIVLLSMVLPLEAAILTKPSDALVSEKGTAVFNCSSVNSTAPMNWRHTPIGSNDSVDFYSFGRMTATKEFYRSGFRVDVSVGGQYNLIISNVTARHAGKYECYSFELVKAAAELGVVRVKPSCYSITTLNLSEAHITCKMEIAGNVKPKLLCQNGWYKSTSSVFRGSQRREEDYYISALLFTTAPLMGSSEETHFACSVLRDYNSPPLIGFCVRANRAIVRPKPEAASDLPKTHPPEANLSTLIVISIAMSMVSTCMSILIVVILGTFLYKRFRDRKRK